MRMPAAFIVSFIGLLGLVSLSELGDKVTKGPRVVRPIIISEDHIGKQQSRAWLNALRGALVQQKEQLRAKSASEGIVLRA